MVISADPRIGSELVGYRIDALLGRGGMSVVYRAEDLALGRNVALKLLAPELAEDQRFRERFQRESRLAASIDHPAIVPVYEAGEVHGQLYIAMRYVEGTDLKALLRDAGALEPERALAIVSQVADALDEAHERGLVHRDVKPSNVLIDRRERCYLADFGLTKHFDDRTDLTGSGRIVGSSDYVAPEVLEGGAVDSRADLYSLGCLLFECLSGEVPYPRDSELAVLWAHVHDPPPQTVLSPELDAVIARALAKDPGARYSTGRLLVEAARQALPKPETPARRRRRLALAAVVAAVAVALAVALPLALTDGAQGTSTKPTLTPAGHAIQRIDPETNELVATLPVPVGEFKLAVGGGWVWAVDVDQNAIFKIDPDRNAVAQTIEGLGIPESVAFGAGFLWVLNARDGIIAQIEPDTGAVAGIASLPPGWGSLIKASDGGVWVQWATREGNAVRVDPRSLAATPVQIGTSPVAEVADFVPVGSQHLWVYGTNPHDPSTSAVLAIDPRQSDLSAADVISLDTFTFGHIAGNRAAAWVTDLDEDRVLEVDGRTRRTRRVVAVGDGPLGIALGQGAVWTANSGDGTISRIDPRTGRVVATIPVGPNPIFVVVGEDAVWVDVHPD